MSKASVGELNERERACLTHVRQAQELKVSFSEYCRQQGLKVNQWYWIKRGLIRKGVIAERGKAEADKPGGFVPVRIAPGSKRSTTDDPRRRATRPKRILTPRAPPPL